MKALEKDRTRRYESANDFARDIQRYLHDEAVEACPPSTVYRLRKFTRRHQAAVIATTAVSLALILGAGVAAGQAYRATKAEKYAEEQLQIAQDQERLAKQQTLLAKKQKKLAEEAAEREGNLRAEAEHQRDLAQEGDRASRGRAQTVRGRHQLPGRYLPQPRSRTRRTHRHRVRDAESSESTPRRGV